MQGKMTSMQRIAATIAGEPVDRRPFSLICSLYGAHLTGAPLSRHYSDPATYVTGQVAMRENILPDILFGPFMLAALGEAFGSELRISQDQAPNIRRPAASNWREAEKLHTPDINSMPRLIYIRESVRLLSSKYRDEAPVAAISLSPVEMPLMIMGLDNWLDTLLFDFDGARRILDKLMPFYIDWTNALLENGAMFAVMPTALLGQLSSAKLMEKLQPYYNQAFEQTNGPVIIHHTADSMLPGLKFCAELPENVIGFVLFPNEIKAARKIFGRKKLLFSGPESLFIATGDKEAVNEECTATLSENKSDNRFVLFGCGSEIELDTSQNKLMQFRSAVEKEHR